MVLSESESNSNGNLPQVLLSNAKPKHDERIRGYVVTPGKGLIMTLTFSNYPISVFRWNDINHSQSLVQSWLESEEV